MTEERRHQQHPRAGGDPALQQAGERPYGPEDPSMWRAGSRGRATAAEQHRAVAGTRTSGVKCRMRRQPRQRRISAIAGTVAVA
ncbi:MAG: hypothetical protein V3T72_04810 [Thermoanaerobaculia bacterium]